MKKEMALALSSGVVDRLQTLYSAYAAGGLCDEHGVNEAQFLDLVALLQKVKILSVQTQLGFSFSRIPDFATFFSNVSELEVHICL